MTTMLKTTAVRQLLFGTRVQRAAAALPQTAHSAIFNITGGRINLIAIIGEVTTIIQAQANNTKLTSYPTVGSAVDMCAVTSINGKEVGSLLTISGLPTDALYVPNAGLGRIEGSGLFVIPIGSIHLDCAASSTGAIKWTAYWTPEDDAGVLTAA